MVITLIPGDWAELMGQPGGAWSPGCQPEHHQPEVQERPALAQRQITQHGPQGRQLPASMPQRLRRRSSRIAGRAIVAEAHRLGLKATDADLRDELEHGR